ncbi:MAG: aminoacyl-tRNA hydrolase [Clostridiaceae bacterium]|jgi:PTH1 family peptidyl-tRNA hydrolase|nr:aminoacyl-tRNA hydrolase [Clostridiaceae bacterium]
MWLIAGLGNPGPKYVYNWHNCGFMALEVLAQRNNISLNRSKFSGSYGKGRIFGEEVVLLRPGTYMNCSGLSIRQALHFYKIEPERLIVVYDDIDLKRGSIRVRSSGGAGTHNGMKSVIGEIGSKDFVRVRIGIGPAPEHFELADFVLSDIPKEDHEQMFTAFTEAALAVEKRVGDFA